MLQKSKVAIAMTTAFGLAAPTSLQRIEPALVTPERREIISNPMCVAVLLAQFYWECSQKVLLPDIDAAMTQNGKGRSEVKIKIR